MQNVDSIEVAIEDKEAKRGGWRATLVWFAAALFYLYEYIVRVVPGVMEEELEVAFSVDGAVLSASIAVYAYIYAPMQLLVGILFDRYGGKRLLVPATLVVAAGCFMVTLSDQLWVLTVGRLLMGFGSAFGFVGAIYMATVWYPAKRVAFLSGMTTGLGMLGAITGETVVSELIESSGWKSSWVILAEVGLMLAVLLYLVIPKTPKWEVKRRQVYERENADDNFLSGLIRICKNRQTWYIGILGGALFLPLSMFGDYWGVQYVRKLTDVSKTSAGFAISFLYLGWLLGGPLSGWISDHMGNRRRLMMWGAALSAIFYWGLFSVTNMEYDVLCACLFFGGVLSSAQVICFIAGYEANEKHLKGTAVAVINMIVTLVGGICLPLVGFWLRSMSQARMEEEYVVSATNLLGDYSTALMILPIVLGVGVIMACLMKETYGNE